MKIVEENKIKDFIRVTRDLFSFYGMFMLPLHYAIDYYKIKFFSIEMQLPSNETETHGNANATQLNSTEMQTNENHTIIISNQTQLNSSEIMVIISFTRTDMHFLFGVVAEAIFANVLCFVEAYIICWLRKKMQGLLKRTPY